MPSQLHEALILLFRKRPALTPELLRDVLHQELPPFSEVRIEGRPQRPAGRGYAEEASTKRLTRRRRQPS